MTTYSPEPQLLDAWLEVGCPASCDLGDLNRTDPRGPGHSFRQAVFFNRSSPVASTPPSPALSCFLGGNCLAFSCPS